MHAGIAGRWTKERSDEAFQLLDEDGSGSISKDEFIGFYTVSGASAD